MGQFIQKVVGLTGYARCGKDTVANYMHHEYDFIRTKCAEPLYSMLAIMYQHLHLTVGDIENLKAANKEMPGSNKTWRYGLQTLGTEWGRHLISQDIWIQLVKQKITIHPDNHWVISDIRFENEAAAIRSFTLPIHPVIIGIVSDREEPQQHESEKDIPSLIEKADFVIANNGTIEQLHSRIRDVVNKMNENNG